MSDPTFNEPGLFHGTATVWAKLKPSLVDIVGTLFLLTVSWFLFGYIWTRGQVALPTCGIPPSVLTKPLGYLVTFISTILAFYSTSFFSSAVGRYISVRLHVEGMSLGDFVSSVRISTTSIIWDRMNWKLTALSLAIVGLTAQQTSGWNTLLMPQVFDHKSAVYGRELDLQLLQSIPSSAALSDCVFNSSNLPGFTVGQTEAGYAALNALSFPVSLNFLDFAFNTSTAGILPLSFDDIPSASYFPGTTDIPGTLSPSTGLDNSLAATSSVTQQGFSADVSCQFEDLTTDTTPSLSFEVDPLPDGVMSVTMNSNCDDTTAAATTVVVANQTVLPGSGFISVNSCSRSDGSYTLIFYGSGIYDFMQTMVCTLTPKVTYVNVESTYSFSGGTISATTLPGGAPAASGAPGMSAITTITDLVYFSQAVQTNIMGDQLKSVLQDASGNLIDDPRNRTEEYLRGVAEYSGSVLRACLSARGGGLSAEGVPQSMTTLSSGKFEAQFFGWEFTLSSSWVLIPGTLVAFATLYAVFLTFLLPPLDPRAKPINPANTMHLVSAAAAGGLADVLTGTDQDKGVHIGVGAFDGLEPAFVKM
ncbi:hypothetical protein K438DRAFT_1968793 [Mycena galopus ATCC 62051]|nr:hypothetical protein K438DRAFT_1968793 [Mycena galopus ATCC 62051]